MEQTKQAVVRWAMELMNADDAGDEPARTLQLYRAVDEDDVPDSLREGNAGEVPGQHGGRIQVIGQTDNSSVYGETTDDVSAADYLCGDVGGSYTDPAMQARWDSVRSLLDAVFGDSDDWPDNYAQVMGWELD